MAIRQTSIDCYNQIKAEGLLTKRRFEVYEAVCNSAPCTSSEAMISRLNSTNVLSQSRARFTELRELGVIYEKGIKKCTVSGRNAIEWDLTDKLPKKTLNAKTTKQKIVELKLMIENLDNSTSDLLIKMELNNIKEYINNNFNK